MSQENSDTIITMVDGSSISGADSDIDEQVCALEEEIFSVSSEDGGSDYDNGEDDTVAPEPVQDIEEEGDNEEQTTQLPETKGKHVLRNKNNFKGSHNRQNHDNNKGKGNYKGANKKSNTGNQHSARNFNSKTGNNRNYQKNSSISNNNSSSTNTTSNNHGHFNKNKGLNSSQNSSQKQSATTNYKNSNHHSTPVNHYNKYNASITCNNSRDTNNNSHNINNHKYNNSNHKNNSGNSNYNNKSINSNNNSNCKKDGGGEKNDIGLLKQLKSFISICTKENEVCQPPIDSLVLKLHYRVGLCIFLLTFSMIQCNWFLRESIYCVYNFNAKETVGFEIKNICLSYPYVCEIPLTTTYEESDCPRRYILFYRWIHFTFLLTAGAYYIPRMISKKAENPRLKKLIVDLAKGEQRYDGSTWEQDTETMLNYIHSHISTHTVLYFWLLLCHVVALVIDVAAIFFFDFLLQGNFLGLVYLAYPFQRHPQNFTDELSHTFPPFVHCKLDGSVLVNNAREDNVGCHLTLMELYEKVFIFLWIWLALITVCTAVSVLFLLLVTLPPFNRLFLCTHSSSKGIRNVKNKVLKLCGHADLYVLYLFKRHRSETQFIMFLTRFVHCCEDKMLVGNDETNPSSLNKKPANTDSALDYSSNMKNEKFLNVNHPLPPDAHTITDFSPPVNKNFLSGFSIRDQIRSRKFDALSSNPEFQPPCSPHFDRIEVH